MRFLYIVTLSLLFGSVAVVSASDSVGFVWAKGRGVRADTSKQEHIIGCLNDPELHTRWEIVTDATRPAAPPRFIEMKTATDAENVCVYTSPVKQSVKDIHRQDSPAVHAGDSVVVWSAQPNAILQLTGIAMAAGHLGDTIPVRTGISTVWLKGKIRAPGYVELISLRDSPARSIP